MGCGASADTTHTRHGCNAAAYEVAPELSASPSPQAPSASPVVAQATCDPALQVPADPVVLPNAVAVDGADAPAALYDVQQQLQQQHAVEDDFPERSPSEGSITCEPSATRMKFRVFRHVVAARILHDIDGDVSDPLAGPDGRAPAAQTMLSSARLVRAWIAGSEAATATDIATDASTDAPQLLLAGSSRDGSCTDGYAAAAGCNTGGRRSLSQSQASLDCSWLSDDRALHGLSSQRRRRGGLQQRLQLTRDVLAAHDGREPTPADGLPCRPTSAAHFRRRGLFGSGSGY